MTDFFVTKVRKVRAGSAGTEHEHIVGVLTPNGNFHSNQAVVDSISARNSWYTDAPDQPRALIKHLPSCPAKDCQHKPYLTTAPDHTTKNNLESLPRG